MWESRYAKRAERVRGSAIRELLKVTERPEFISFGGGLPAPEVFPTDAVRQALDKVLRTQPGRALQYSTTEGYTPLRQWLAQSLSKDNLHLDADNILITSGSQQALDLIGKLLVDEGSNVVVESPTYLATLQCWRTYGAIFTSVPSDDDGLVTAGLPPVLATSPRLIYCVPNFQNPRGVTISEPRRRDLVDMARKFDVAIIEDDPYRDLRFEGDPLPSLMELDGANGNVLALGSFSKVLTPGLRVGWIAGPKNVIEKLTLIKQGTDLHTATVNQMAVYELVASGTMARHRHVIVDEYRRRRDAMLAAMAAHFPQDVHWTRPSGGMFLWVTLPEGVNAMRVLEAAIQHKVAFVPGEHFHAEGGHVNTMRLNFSNAVPDKIWEGIGRLAEAVRENTDVDRSAKIMVHP
jgi:2-aminoadipate transaminase